MISKQLVRRLLTRGERFLGDTKACLIVQSILCTSSKLAWACREASARLLQKASRAQGSLYVQGTRLAVQGVLCTSSQLAWACKECFARSSFREIQSIDILVPKIVITYLTLQMTKICPKRRFFNDKNDAFWLGFGFKI